MSTLGEFIHMGGYGVYVWSAYAIVAVVLIGNLIVPVLQARELKRRLARQIRFARRDARSKPA